MIPAVRILGITNLYPPYAGGGYGEICADTMAGLSARGHEVTMLVARGETGRGVNVRAELDYVLAPWRHPVRGLRAVAHDERLVRDALTRGVDAAVVWHMRGLVRPPLTLLHRADAATCWSARWMAATCRLEPGHGPGPVSARRRRVGQHASRRR